jgi:hypothetical protein
MTMRGEQGMRLKKPEKGVEVPFLPDHLLKK